MENGLRVKTTEGSPQGGPLSPLLANIYLNEYDKEMASRGVPVIRYIVSDDLPHLGTLLGRDVELVLGSDAECLVPSIDVGQCAVHAPAAQ